ncbi:MAG: hypothetical protein AAFX10_13615 [Pseudomonadota bacterium]
MSFRRASAPALITIASLGLVAAANTLAQQAWEPGQLPPEPERVAPAVNVSITLFDPGVPDDVQTQRDLEVFPRIREIESLFLPFVLRRVLDDAGGWGVVRVVPDKDPAAELLVDVTIVESDGERLALDVRAVDATGRVWLEQSFRTETTSGYSGVEALNEPAESNRLYADIARELVVVRDALSEREFRAIVDTSLMRYAIGLVPDAFAEFVEEEPPGRYKLLRLPARNDPMLGRINRLRTVEYAITDTVDEKYQELHAEIASTYDLWREYRRRYRRYLAAEAERAASEPSDAPTASYESLMDRYRRYKWDRQAEQEQEAWAVGFNNEVAPTIERIGTRIDELERWVQQESVTWERILAEFYELEQELASPAD